MIAALAPDTKSRILNAAEKLFAETGIESTSLRQITGAAQVNLASVNYHFQSKDELVRAVYLRRLRPANQARIERLDRLEEQYGGEGIPLEELLDAFYRPMLDLWSELEVSGISIGKILGRIYTEFSSVIEDIWVTEMREVAMRFSQAFARSLPHLTPTEAFWRMHFSVGVMAHTMAGAKKIQALSNGAIDPTDHELTLRQIVAYVKAGMLAPSLERPR